MGKSPRPSSSDSNAKSGQTGNITASKQNHGSQCLHCLSWRLITRLNMFLMARRSVMPSSTKSPRTASRSSASSDLESAFVDRVQGLLIFALRFEQPPTMSRDSPLTSLGKMPSPPQNLSRSPVPSAWLDLLVLRLVGPSTS